MIIIMRLVYRFNIIKIIPSEMAVFFVVNTKRTQNESTNETTQTIIK